MSTNTNQICDYQHRPSITTDLPEEILKHVIVPYLDIMDISNLRCVCKKLKKESRKITDNEKKMWHFNQFGKYILKKITKRLKKQLLFQKKTKTFHFHPYHRWNRLFYWETEREITYLHNAPDITHLSYLITNQIKSINQLGLTMDLRGDNISRLKSVLENGKNIINLQLSNCNLDSNSIQYLIKFLPNMRVLTTLRLGDNQIGNIGGMHLIKILHQMPYLRVLDLQRNKSCIETIQSQLLAEWRNCEKPDRGLKLQKNTYS